MGRLLAFSIASVMAVSAGATACSGNSDDGGSGDAREAIARITASARLYTPDDLKAAGMKVARMYDPSGLPPATAALNGFLNRVEYEARFYPSHAEAAASGAAAAALVTGPEAIVMGAAIPWEEGATDRRKCVGAINANCVAKYGDFVVYGNMVLLCEGRDSATSLAACAVAVKGLPPP